MNLSADTDLRSLAVSLGEVVETAGNLPVDLGAPEVAWYVEQGSVDIFFVGQENGIPNSSAKHILRANECRLLFGVDTSDMPLAVVAKGLPGTILREIRLETLLARTEPEAIAGQVDAWITDFSETVAYQIDPRPWTDVVLHAGDELEIAPQTVLSTQPGRLIWGSSKTGAYLGTEEIADGGVGFAPLTSDTWLTISEKTRVTGWTSQELAETGQLIPALSGFHNLILGAEQLNRRLLIADEANEQSDRTMHRRIDEESARRELFGVLSDQVSAFDATGSTLIAAMRLVGKYEGIEFQIPQTNRPAIDVTYSMQEIANASEIRFRKIRLTTEDRWWFGDSGAMLGSLKDDGSSIALIPSTRGRYRAVDPTTGKGRKIDAGLAETIEPTAWFFYRPLPRNEPVRASGLLRFMGDSMAADIGWFALTGLLASLLLLAPAIAIGELTDWVLPTHATGILVQFMIAIIVITFVAASLQVLHGTALMRMEGRAAARASAAAWDRLLALPPSFFNQFTAGDLASRLSVFLQLRDQISGVAANALLSVVFLLPTFVILFIYDTTLAWLSILLGLTSLGITAAVGYLQINPIRRRFKIIRGISGDLYQFINGLSKLRTAGAESSAFASWARRYREQQLQKIQIGRRNEHLIAFSAALPALAAAMLLGAVVWRGAEQVDLASFLVVYSVAMLFYAAIVRLGHAFETIATIIPAYEQIQPILESLPQDQSNGLHTTTINLTGHVKFDHVTFRYSDDGPLIIDDVSFEVRPGEFVAIVGESGSGKSTLLRLALGLEDPTSGSVYYDERELAYLDRKSVRRQIGVVTQDGVLQPGDILDNIIGMGDDLTIEDAWRAARLANIDQDINAMPMGMFTPVSDNSSTFSGGQTQRVRIAAALVRRPRVVFLDEATSWLDARSQAAVMRGIESIASTRIVIAHRLSTIQKAERIYVLQSGRIVQQGSFDELSQKDGPFQELIKRQMT